MPEHVPWPSERPSETLATARADALRHGSPAERAEAAALYLAHPASFDPSTEEGRTRLLWLVRAGRAAEPACQDAVARASTTSPDDELRRAATAARGTLLVRRGDHDGAEEVLLSVLRDRRAAAPDADDLTACLALSLSCRVRLREFEALVFARRAQRIAEALDDAAAHALALLHLGACRMDLGALPAADRTFDHLEAILGAVEQPRAAAIARQVRCYRADLSLRVGDLAAARRHIDAWAGSDLPTDGIDHFDLARTDAEAQWALAAGRPADALASLDAVPRRLAPAFAQEFDVELRRASALVALGRAAAFVVVADPLLSHLLDHGQRVLGAGRAFVFASDLGRLVQDSGGPVTLAARAHEFAARMALARLGELESAAQRLDVADVLQDADRQDLARFRASFAERHRSALEALSADFHGVPAEAVERLAGFVHGDGAVRICAWCLMAWLPDGRTAPVGHILQSAAPDAVTHGICPACLDVVRRGADPPVWPGGRTTEL